MSAVTLNPLSYSLPQENRVSFPSAAQEAEFSHLINCVGFPLKREDFTPMHIAVMLGDLAACRHLIASGWDPNEMGECGFSPYFILMVFFIGQSAEMECEKPDADKHREIADLLFDALYAKGGISNPRAQYRAWDRALHIAADSPNSFENTLTREECGIQELLYTSGKMSIGDEQMAWSLLDKLRSQEEIAILLVHYMNIWTHDALICFLPKLTIQTQVTLLDNALRLSGHEELFCKVWDNASLEVRKASYWMHDAVRNGKNGIIAHLLGTNTYNIQSVNNYNRSVLYFATEYKHKIDPQLYQEIATADAGYSQTLFEARTFGHRFSLSGPLLAGAKPRESREFVSILANSIQEWSLTWNGPDQDALRKRIDTIRTTMLLAIQDTPSDELYEKSRSGSVLILSGPLTHAVDFIINRNCLVKIDTSQQERVMKCYDISYSYRENLVGTIEHLKIKTLEEKLAEAKKITNCRDEDLGLLSEVVFKRYWEVIKGGLELQLSTFDFHLQTAGNCAWEAHKAAIFALFYLEIIHESKSSAEMQRSATCDNYIQNICASYLSFQSNWPSFDSTKGFREGLPALSKLGFDLRRDIFSGVILHCLQRGDLYRAKIEQPIIDILNIEPAMSNWTFKKEKRVYSLLELAQEAELNTLSTYLKVFCRAAGPPRITYIE